MKSLLRADPMRIAVAAEYDSPRALLAAARAMRAHGYERLDAYTPYPLEEVEEALGIGRTRLPALVFAAGLLGAVAAYLLQYYCNTYDYPINVGGRPLHPVPAYVPITFETMILFASFAAFAGFFAAGRLPEPWNPLFEIDGFEHASVDRFWLGVDGRDPRYDVRRTVGELMATPALRVVHPRAVA